MAKKSTWVAILAVLVLLVAINLGVSAATNVDYMAKWFSAGVTTAIYVIAGIFGAMAIWAFAKQRKTGKAWLYVLVPAVLLNQAIIVAFSYDVLGLLGTTVKMVVYIAAALVAVMDLFAMAKK